MGVRYFDGRKAVRVEDLPEEAWQIVRGEAGGTELDKLYSTVAWLYRCVEIRAGAVGSLPFEVRRKGRSSKPVYEFDGITAESEPPAGLVWLDDLPELLMKVEAACILGGRAYLERRPNMLGGVWGLAWLLPWTVLPRYGADDLSHFERQLGAGRKAVRLEREDVVYFWPPDYGVELGPAVNYPGRAVMQNASVIGSMDLFLKGYFDRGMVKATLLKYKDQISPDEAKRVKEWWKRIFAGVKNAFATEVVRGDFEAMTIGEGIRDLRDNALTDKERESIAAGLGVPQSKVAANAANFATKQSDDVMFVEDTILPEVRWIYQELNKQLLHQLGYHIVALPERLRVMQEDENKRATAFAAYVGNGLPIETAIEILGIDVPDGLPLEKEIPPALAAFAAGQGPAAENGEEQQPPPQQPGGEAPPRPPEQRTIAAALANDEAARFLRWAKKRTDKPIRIGDFESEWLSDEEKVMLAVRAIQQSRPAIKAKIDDEAEAYLERIAAMALDLAGRDLGRQAMIDEMAALVKEQMTAQFRIGAAIGELEDLDQAEVAALGEVLEVNLNAIPGLVDAVLKELGSEKGVGLERIAAISAGIAARLGAWKSSLLRAFHLGKLWNRDDPEYTWRLGATEKHCQDCLELHGQRMRASEWRNLRDVGIYPQSPSLECKGFRCSCSLD